ncbi:phage tail protein [Cellvibrio sp. KY-GH-1]|uniref:phage tail protein n=1 Tax=Cellvibrio sp. KY-GH-1 TaxID=2303332 RepID=UPI001246713F|nr:tail fiber protein [Cellvibrio sp. KY-GH-1]QEY15866.1 phage tail protein [Cellvibrio sp. KY-GH-1]
MSDPFIGEIRMFAGTYAPRGWAFCQGQQLAIASNTALFSLLGTTYGGNGTTTFALPDLRSRVPVGTGAGPGLSAITLGEVAGTENVNVLSTNVPAMVAPVTATASVAIPVNATNGTTKTPANTLVLSTTSDTAAGAEVDLYSAGPGTTTLQPFNATVTGQAAIPGGSQPLGIRNPFLGMNFIIALEGIYPSRN